MANPNRTLPGLGLRWMNVGEDDWGPDYNEDHRILSALVNNSVKSRTTDAPAITPTVGDIYIVPASATGDFAGQDEAIAIWDGDIGSEAWVFITPAEGWTLYVLDEDLNYQFDGTVWSEFSSGAGVTYLDRVLIDMAVIDASLATPPGSPSDGDAYIVAATATGDWAGQEDNIAIYEDTAWVFYTPMEGYILRDQANNLTYQFDGTLWTEFVSGSGSAGGSIVSRRTYSTADLESGNDELRIDLTDADFAEIFVRDISCVAAARAQWQLSNDGGATVIAGTSYSTYFRIDGGSGSYFETSAVLFGATAVTGSYSGAVSISNLATTSPKTFKQVSENGGTPRDHDGWVDTNLAVDTLVITPDTATTFDAIDIEVVLYKIGADVTEITVDNNGLELIGVYDLSTFTLDSGNELEVNVEAYSQLIVDVQAATFGTADNIKMQASDDGGATYFTGSTDYERWNFTNSSEDLGLDQNSIGIVPSGNTDSTAYWIFTGLNNQDTPISGFGFSGATANFAQRHRLQASHSGINAIKFFSGSGNAATGGKLILYGVPKGPESRQALGFVERTYTTSVSLSTEASKTWDIPDNCIHFVVHAPEMSVSASAVTTLNLNKNSDGAASSFDLIYNIATNTGGAAFTQATQTQLGGLTCDAGSEFTFEAWFPRSLTEKTRYRTTLFDDSSGSSSDRFLEGFGVQATAEDVDELLLTRSSGSYTGDMYITYTVLEAEVGYKKPTITTTTPLTLADVPALAEIDTSAGNLTVTLPPNAPQGTIWDGIIIDATNVVTVSAPSGENLDGVTDGSGDMTQALGAEASFRKTSVGWFSTGDMGVVS